MIAKMRGANSKSDGCSKEYLHVHYLVRGICEVCVCVFTLTLSQRESQIVGLGVGGGEKRKRPLVRTSVNILQGLAAVQ